MGGSTAREGRRSGLWFDHIGREVRWCVEHGRELVLGGKGAVEAKQALGFESYRQWTVLRRLAAVIRGSAESSGCGEIAR